MGKDDDKKKDDKKKDDKDLKAKKDKWKAKAKKAKAKKRAIIEKQRQTLDIPQKKIPALPSFNPNHLSLYHGTGGTTPGLGHNMTQMQDVAWLRDLLDKDRKGLEKESEVRGTQAEMEMRRARHALYGDLSDRYHALEIQHMQYLAAGNTAAANEVFEKMKKVPTREAQMLYRQHGLYHKDEIANVVDEIQKEEGTDIKPSDKPKVEVKTVKVKKPDIMSEDQKKAVALLHTWFEEQPASEANEKGKEVLEAIEAEPQKQFPKYQVAENQWRFKDRERGGTFDVILDPKDKSLTLKRNGLKDRKITNFAGGVILPLPTEEENKALHVGSYMANYHRRADAIEAERRDQYAGYLRGMGVPTDLVKKWWGHLIVDNEEKHNRLLDNSDMLHDYVRLPYTKANVEITPGFVRISTRSSRGEPRWVVLSGPDLKPARVKALLGGESNAEKDSDFIVKRRKELKAKAMSEALISEQLPLQWRQWNKDNPAPRRALKHRLDFLLNKGDDRTTDDEKELNKIISLVTAPRESVIRTESKGTLGERVEQRLKAGEEIDKGFRMKDGRIVVQTNEGRIGVLPKGSQAAELLDKATNWVKGTWNGLSQETRDTIKTAALYAALSWVATPTAALLGGAAAKGMLHKRNQIESQYRREELGDELDIAEAESKVAAVKEGKAINSAANARKLLEEERGAEVDANKHEDEEEGRKQDRQKRGLAYEAYVQDLQNKIKTNPDKFKQEMILTQEQFNAEVAKIKRGERLNDVRNTREVNNEIRTDEREKLQHMKDLQDLKMAVAKLDEQFKNLPLEQRRQAELEMWDFVKAKMEKKGLAEEAREKLENATHMSAMQKIARGMQLVQKMNDMGDLPEDEKRRKLLKDRKADDEDWAHEGEMADELAGHIKDAGKTVEDAGDTLMGAGTARTDDTASTDKKKPKSNQEKRADRRRAKKAKQEKKDDEKEDTTESESPPASGDTKLSSVPNPQLAEIGLVTKVAGKGLQVVGDVVSAAPSIARYGTRFGKWAGGGIKEMWSAGKSIFSKEEKQKRKDRADEEVQKENERKGRVAALEANTNRVILETMNSMQGSPGMENEDVKPPPQVLTENGYDSMEEFNEDMHSYGLD
jgi:hypothetical protein